mmetsp:Transcript_42903/g.135382  ORF Transcript_42903/g.135382 Transcript_42903/m.135382 type:complete len:99 (-) Transcript_42903:3426-3722(-)
MPRWQIASKIFPLCSPSLLPSPQLLLSPCTLLSLSRLLTLLACSQRTLDVYGSASKKANLQPEPYKRWRGQGAPPRQTLDLDLERLGTGKLYPSLAQG